jgi:hypothetical protein
MCGAAIVGITIGIVVAVFYLIVVFLTGSWTWLFDGPDKW